MKSLSKIPTALVFTPLYLLILIATEWSLRVWYPSRAMPNIIPDTQLHHAYRPNITFTTFPNAAETFSPAINEINSMGLRGALPPTKQETRVILLGDSFVQADEVRFQETFGQLLNRYFKNKIEFIAHGIVSWSPTPEFSWLHHYGFSLQPDHIVLFLCVNDFFDPNTFHQTDAIYRRQAIYQNGIPVAYDLPEKTWSESIFEHSAIIRLTNRFYRKVKPILKNSSSKIPSEIANETIIFGSKNNLWPYQIQKNVKETLAVIEDIQKASLAIGVKLHVTLVPLPFSWSDEAVTGKALHPYNWPADFTVSQNGIEEYIRNRLSDFGISWIDLQQSFARAKRMSKIKLFNEVDGHWNANGHQIVFESISSYFDQKKTNLSRMKFISLLE